MSPTPQNLEEQKSARDVRALKRDATKKLAESLSTKKSRSKSTKRTPTSAKTQENGEGRVTDSLASNVAEFPKFPKVPIQDVQKLDSPETKSTSVTDVISKERTVEQATRSHMENATENLSGADTAIIDSERSEKLPTEGDNRATNEGNRDHNVQPTDSSTHEPHREEQTEEIENVKMNRDDRKRKKKPKPSQEDDVPTEADRPLIARRLSHHINLNILDESDEISSSQLLKVEPFSLMSISQHLVKHNIPHNLAAVRLIFEKPYRGATPFDDAPADIRDSVMRTIKTMQEAEEKLNGAVKALEKLEADSDAGRVALEKVEASIKNVQQYMKDSGDPPNSKNE